MILCTTYWGSSDSLHRYLVSKARLAAKGLPALNKERCPQLITQILCGACHSLVLALRVDKAGFLDKTCLLFVHRFDVGAFWRGNRPRLSWKCVARFTAKFSRI